MGVPATRKGEAEWLAGGARRLTVRGQQLSQASGVRVDKLAAVDHEAVDDGPEAGSLPAVLLHVLGGDQSRTARSALQATGGRHQVLRAQARVRVVSRDNSHARSAETVGRAVLAACSDEEWI